MQLHEAFPEEPACGDSGGSSSGGCGDSGSSSGGCIEMGSEDNDDACMDGIDNDCNGYTDCDDFVCSMSPNVAVCR